MNRRSFFAALAAPLLAPLRKLLPAASAQPVLKAGDRMRVACVGIDPAAGLSVPVLYFWGRDGLSILDGAGQRVISHQPYPYWHGQPPFTFAFNLNPDWHYHTDKIGKPITINRSPETPLST